MPWNWQLADWPAFTYDATGLREAEARSLTVVGSTGWKPSLSTAPV